MSIPLERPSLIGERPLLAIGFAWVAVCLLMTLTSPHLAAGRFPDVDDALRMVQVRDLLAGQGWYDLYQHRMNPPKGTLMHWSRLVDAPLAAGVWLLALVMPQASAEYVAAFTFPLLLLLATMLVMGRLALERFGLHTVLFAALAFALVPMVPAQFQPMRIDHHAWQVLSVAVATWAVFRRDPARGAPVAGLAMATGLMISLETIVMAAGFALLLGLRWLLDPRDRLWLARYLQGLAVGLVAVFAATRGLADLAPHCDVIAPAHLGFFAIVATGASLLATPAWLHRAVVIAGLGISGLAGLALIGWAAPACLASPFAGLDPLVHEHWYLKVTEGLPLWQRDPVDAVPAALQCLIALGITGFAALKGNPAHRGWWREYALLLLVATLAGLATYRSIAFAGMLATIPLGWFAAAMIARWRSSASLAPKLGVAAALYATFLPAAITGMILPRLAAIAPIPQHLSIVSTCDIPHHGAALNALAPGKVFANLDIAPGVLAYSHHSVVASGHHRSQDAMRTVIAAFLGTPDQAREMILASGSDYVMACLDMAEMSLYMQSGGEGSLAARLMRGTAPAWLEPVALDTPRTLGVWRVVRPSTARGLSPDHSSALR